MSEMTELERLELVLRRVHDRLYKTPRFTASDELYLLARIIEALVEENIEVVERKKPEPRQGTPRF